MAATAAKSAKEQTVRIMEPEKELRPKPPPLETSLSVASSSGPKTPTSGSFTPRHERERKIGHRRVDQAGQVTYKKKPTSELMATIQLGIGQSVGSLSSKPERDVLLQDFAVVDSSFFPREGSNLTPAHHYSDFRFKTYAPIAFRYFRELFGIQPDDFLLSLCNEALNELSNPGASGSIFYITNDDEFIIKTVQHKEAEFLQKLLPGYYMNLNQNPRTLLPKFYGLYCYQCGGKNIRFIVMNNLLPSSIKMHEKYDLKGSTYKRKASKHERAKNSPTLKDLDFLDKNPEGIMLEAETYNAMIKTIERDCRVLQSFKIMDYSLLLGVHNLDQAAREREAAEAEIEAGASSTTTPHPLTHQNTSLSRGRSVRQRIANYSTAMEAIQAEAEPVELENEDVPPGGIPARNSKGERLLLYIGLIDILQSYRLKKKLEHAMKAMVHDGDTISVHRPGFYAQRFQGFFASKVFKKIPSLDQPHIKGPHVRFRKLVHLALKHSPSKKKGVTQRARSATSSDVEGAVGGRPDLLPATSTPPPTFAEAMQDKDRQDGTGHGQTVHFTNASHMSKVVSTVMEQKGIKLVASDIKYEGSSGIESDGLHPSSGSGLLNSPVHSISESTPTHTEYTEGTPSFTTSSPSCSSDMLASDTPQSSVRSSTLKELTTDHIECEILGDQAKSEQVEDNHSQMNQENDASHNAQVTHL